MENCQVELKKATKLYGETAAIREVNLQIKAKEFFSILGPSGSGKTTILRAIAGLLRLSSGQILIGGRPMENVPVFKRGLSIVFQNYALFPHINIFDNVAFGLRMQKVPPGEVRQRVMEALERVRLPGMEKRRPSQLSGGQQQRIALARAVVVKPEVMLLDEPLGALDRNLRENMQVELKSLQRDLGITTVMVTHDQEEALSLSDRIAVIDRGRIEQVGSPSDIYERPVNRFVAGFIGGTNLIPGTVREEEQKGLIVETAEGIRIRASAGQRKTAVGDSVSVAIRPEKILLSAEASAGAENQLQGVIENVVYMGASTTFHLRVKDRLLVVVEKNAGPEPPFAKSQAIFIQWARSATRTLAD